MDAVARARGCLGARFRPHGRTIAGGLDCVGLAAIAHDLRDVPGGYALRGGRIETVTGGLAAAGFAPVGAVWPGDLMLLEAGAFQLHLAVAVPGGFVHADAGLRRVVEVPGMPRWPLLSCWRKG